MSLADFFSGPKEVKPPAGTIILDMSNLIFRALFADQRREDTSEAMFRHLAVSQVLRYRKKFSKEEYPTLVAAFDGQNLWRKEVFPQYKKNRDPSLKLAKIEDPDEQIKAKVEGEEMMASFAEIRDELLEYLPYPTLRINKAEADDVITVIAKNSKKAVIVSSDGDFQQLAGPTIKIFSPAIGSDGSFFPEDTNVERDIFEKICRGDSGDGVPNILSCDETFWPVKIRQNQVSSKKVNHWWDNKADLKSVMDETTFKRFTRNKTMIDLNEIPADIQQEILWGLETKLSKNDMMASSKFVMYLMSRDLKHLLGNAHHF
jgi:hypothetical protein